MNNETVFFGLVGAIFLITIRFMRILSQPIQAVRIKVFQPSEEAIETITDHWLPITVLFSALISIVSFLYFLHLHEVTAFADARSRLIIARGVVDSLNEGLEQTGAPWLPVQLLATAATAKINFMYRTGMSGAIVSMVSFVLASYFSYRLSRLIFGDPFAAFIGVVAMSGPNLLYMQSVPMAEVPFLACLAGAFYYMARHLYEPECGIFYSAFYMAGAMMTRYEGWIIFLAFLGIVGIAAWRKKPHDVWYTAFRMGQFSIYPATVLTVWFIYNQAILGDWLYFYHGQYAAAAFAGNSSLSTAGKPVLSFVTYGLTTLDSVGWIISALAILGVGFFAFSKKTPGMIKILAFGLLLPFPIFVLLTYMGGSVVILYPALMHGANWGTRYGVIMSLSAGFFVGYLAHVARRMQFRRVRLQALFLPLIAASFVLTIHTGVITREEALGSRSGEQARTLQKAGDWLAENYDGGHILMQRGNDTDAVFEATKTIKSKHLVHEGNRAYWTHSLTNPVGNRWIFMRTSAGTGDDKVYQTYRDSAVIKDRYELAFEAPGVKIYKLKETEVSSLGR